jgi:hypothetical protein
MTYRVTFHTYSGFRSLDETFDSRQEARDFCATMLRRRRDTGHYCTALDWGEWEAQEPEDCALVPDTAGYLTLDPREAR